MKIHFILILSFFHSFSLKGQKHDYNWLVGYVATTPHPELGLSMLKFNGNNEPIISSEDKGIMDFNQTCAAISDKTGKLAFYSNGCFVANAKHDSLKFGRIGLRQTPYSIIQGALILPYPQKDSLYLVIHQNAGFFPNVFQGKPLDWYGTKQTFYSIVDMSKNNGNGEVITRRNFFLPDSFYAGIGSLVAMKQPDGINWWIYIMESLKNRILLYQLTSEGLSYVSTQTMANYFHDGVGGTVISPDGKKWLCFEIMVQLMLNILRFMI
jgi:hypothetical protein